MEAMGQGQEAHRLVGAVGFGKDFRDHLVPPNAGTRVCLSTFRSRTHSPASPRTQRVEPLSENSFLSCGSPRHPPHPIP